MCGVQINMACKDGRVGGSSSGYGSGNFATANIALLLFVISWVWDCEDLISVVLSSGSTYTSVVQ